MKPSQPIEFIPDRLPGLCRVNAVVFLVSSKKPDEELMLDVVYFNDLQKAIIENGV